ncbi:hypothetical protein FWF48_02270 [Candidatus Saccharibacteria bacterium]|nr:hypothetical protein [Candidatus Saccharibacteria bacterium]
MIPLALVIGLFTLYVLASKHAGPAHLASIAGVAINEMAGGQVTNVIANVASSLPRDVISKVVYLTLVLGFPTLLYLKSAKEKRSLISTAENAVFAILTASLITVPFAGLLATDSLSRTCIDFIQASLPFTVVAGTVVSYIDVVFYKDHKKH